MERLILEIEERLRAEVPELGTVDENYGQFQKMFEEDEESDIYPVVSPAALIDVREVSWSNLSGAQQRGVATVVVALAIDCYDDTHATSEQRQRISERMSLMKRVHWALQGWKPSETTKLIRIQTRLYHLPRLWKVYESTYECVTLDTKLGDTRFGDTRIGDTRIGDVPRGEDGLPLSIYD